MEPVLLYDTTLRDGTQGENINFSSEEKIRIARRLDDMGIHYIEGGWPGSNPRDKKFFELAKNIKWKNAKISAFGSTRRPFTLCDKDQNLLELIASQTPVVTIFGKSWDLHVEIMKSTQDENLAMIEESVSFLCEKGKEVIYDAEHFFDGYKDNRDYALKTLAAAVKGGSRMLVLCDTNGGTLTFELRGIIKDVMNFFKHEDVKFGIHTHNDSGLAVANTVEAIHLGATMVQGTVNGYGERCGNADLMTIIPILCLKMKRDCMTEENLKKILRLSRFVSEMANIVPLNTRPFVGKSAFAHKGGIHVSAVIKDPRAYEHVNPESVGNHRNVLVSDLSGKSNVEFKAKELGLKLGGNGYTSEKIVKKIKRLEQEGYQFDVADGSFKILLEKYTEQFQPAFELESFRVTVEKNKNGPCNAHATIKISVAGQEEITAAEGKGPVSALDNALRKALYKFFPCVNLMHLVDFKVRVIDGRDGTGAKVRVLIASRDPNKIWNTMGVSEDIIEASWQALADSFYYKLANARPQL